MAYKKITLEQKYIFYRVYYHCAAFVCILTTLLISPSDISPYWLSLSLHSVKCGAGFFFKFLFFVYIGISKLFVQCWFSFHCFINCSCSIFRLPIWGWVFHLHTEDKLRHRYKCILVRIVCVLCYSLSALTVGSILRGDAETAMQPKMKLHLFRLQIKIQRYILFAANLLASLCVFLFSWTFLFSVLLSSVGQRQLSLSLQCDGALSKSNFHAKWATCQPPAYPRKIYPAESDVERMGATYYSV